MVVKGMVAISLPHLRNTATIGLSRELTVFDELRQQTALHG